MNKFLSVLFLGVLIIVVGSGIVIAASTSGGESSGSGVVVIDNPIGASTIAELLDKIINFLIIIGGSILTLMIIVGAFKLLTANGEEEKIIEGRKTIYWAIVGYAIIFISKGIILIIQQVLK
ncbi:MAG: hypothetical protein PHN74_02315 [Candidatus Pacebacteria bacterium]|nr:hypothetical protein [Candidatus Paceibacterota bacterium]